MGTLTCGRQKDREKLTAISKWRIVPLVLATVWVGWGDGQNSHFSWAWLPATWKLISQVDSSVLRLEALGGVCAEVGQLQPSSLSPETQPAQAPGRATELILPPSLASKPQRHEGVISFTHAGVMGSPVTKESFILSHPKNELLLSGGRQFHQPSLV